MWVRSQNKDLIANVEAFRINSYHVLGKHYIEGGIDNFYALGEYSTQEQCEEILDEIESVINNGRPFVYKMPEDDSKEDRYEIPKDMPDFTVDESMVLENAIKKREEVEEAVRKFKEGFHAS